jgi:hypothetical protein
MHMLLPLSGVMRSGPGQEKSAEEQPSDGEHQ